MNGPSLYAAHLCAWSARPVCTDDALACLAGAPSSCSRIPTLRRPQTWPTVTGDKVRADRQDGAWRRRLAPPAACGTRRVASFPVLTSCRVLSRLGGVAAGRLRGAGPAAARADVPMGSAGASRGAPCPAWPRASGARTCGADDGSRGPHCPGLCFLSSSHSTRCWVVADPSVGRPSWALVAAAAARATAALAAAAARATGTLSRRPVRPLRRCGRRRPSRSARAPTRTHGRGTPTGRRTRPSATASLTGAGTVVAADKGAAGAMADGGAGPEDWRGCRSCARKTGCC